MEKVAQSGSPSWALCIPLSLVHTGAASAEEVTSKGEKQMRKSMDLYSPDRLAWKNTTKTPTYYSAHKLPPKLNCEENKSIFLKM